MKIIRAKDYKDMSRKAANIISAPVSYTHLDVYKRQDRAAAQPSAGLGDGGGAG